MTGQSYTRDPRFVAQKAKTFNACQRGRFFRRLDPTSALGKKQTLSGVRSMSALPPKADIDGLRGPLAERFRQKLCRIPSIVRLMPFSSLVGLPMFTVRCERYFGSPC